MQQVLLTLCTLLLTLGGLQAQRYTKAFSSGANQRLEILAENIALEIEGHSGNEVIIETDDYQEREADERASGLRPLYNNATDNTGIGLEVAEANNVMTIKKASSKDMTYRLKVPRRAGLSIEEVGWMGDEIRIRNFAGEVEIKGTGSDIHLQDITGPVVANTTSGDIDIVFSQVNQEQPMSISNVSGHIDVSLPAATKATFDLSSVSGEIYTNLDIKTGGEEGDLRRMGGRKIHGALNGGGVEISLRAISDNIYLRKREAN